MDCGFLLEMDGAGPYVDRAGPFGDVRLGILAILEEVYSNVCVHVCVTLVQKSS